MASTVTYLGVTSTQDGLSRQDRSIRLSYLVVFDSASGSNAINAKYQAGVPQLNSVLDGDVSLIAIRHGSDLEPGDDSTINCRAWVEFGNKATAIGASTDQPWQNKDTISFGDAKYERAMTEDFTLFTPKKIVNTANDPFETPVMRTYTNPLLRIHRLRRQFEFNPFRAKSCQDTLNEGAFVIRRQTGDVTVGSEKAVLHSVQAHDGVWHDGTLYYEIDMEIELEGQIPLKTLVLQNKGYRELRTVGGTKQFMCVDKVPDPDFPGDATKFLKKSDGKPIYVPVNHPCFLKTDGTRLEDGKELTEANGYKDLSFIHYPKADWSGFMS